MLLRRWTDPWLASRAQLRGPNVSLWQEAISQKRAGVPIITVSNHVGEWDDPTVLAALPLRQWNPRIRPFHSLGHHNEAKDSSFYYRYFVQPHVLSVRIGDGIRQPAVGDAAAFLQTSGLDNSGDPWLHIFAEGAASGESATRLRTPIKHGIARIILECQPIRPLILPFIHLPQSAMIYPGRPIDGGVLVARMPAHLPLAVMYYSLTRHLQDQLVDLYRQVE